LELIVNRASDRELCYTRRRGSCVGAANGRAHTFRPIARSRRPHRNNLAGNAMRFDQGEVPLRADDQWTSDLPRSTRLVSLAIAAPVMPSLGYPLRPR
jgi:hypothetical protein